MPVGKLSETNDAGDSNEATTDASPDLDQRHRSRVCPGENSIPPSGLLRQLQHDVQQCNEEDDT